MNLFRSHRLMNEEGEGTPAGGAAAPAPAAAPAAAAPAASPAAAPAAAAPAPAAPAWGDDWREQLAGGDEKALKQLARMSSPKDVWNKARSLEQRLSSGELRSVLPKDAKPEEVAKWREENGIPKEPKDYEMPKGLVIGDTDKPLIDGFVTAMHGVNATKEQVATAVDTYYKMQEQQKQAIAEKDATDKQTVEESLRAEWGGEYRGNLNAVMNWLDSSAGGVKDLLLSARLPDGRGLFNSPEAVKWLVSTARELNPAGLSVPAGGSQAQTISDELDSIKALMADQKSKYWKGPEAEKLQQRFRDLINAQERIKK